MRTIHRRQVALGISLTAALMLAGAGGAIADPTPNDHNCEGVIGNEGNGYPGLYAEIAHQQLDLGALPADRLGSAWAGGVDENATRSANCGANRES